MNTLALLWWRAKRRRIPRPLGDADLRARAMTQPVGWVDPLTKED